MTRTIQIREVPDDVHRELRIRAAAAGLSLSAYLLREVERFASRPAVAEVLQRAAARREGARPEAIRAAVREGRDRDE